MKENDSKGRWSQKKLRQRNKESGVGGGRNHHSGDSQSGMVGVWKNIIIVINISIWNTRKYIWLWEYKLREVKPSGI